VLIVSVWSVDWQVNECVSSWVANSEDPKLYKGSQCAMIHDSLTRAHLFLFPGISRTTS